jgi:hypothetical protein
MLYSALNFFASENPSPGPAPAITAIANRLISLEIQKYVHLAIMRWEDRSRSLDARVQRIYQEELSLYIEQDGINVNYKSKAQSRPTRGSAHSHPAEISPYYLPPISHGQQSFIEREKMIPGDL